jgi:hypothetical protein
MRVGPTLKLVIAAVCFIAYVALVAAYLVLLATTPTG